LADRQKIDQISGGFTLIELLVVLVIIAVVWIAVLPMVQPSSQRQARDWQREAQALLTLSCDLAVQTMQPHRVVVKQQTLYLEQWQQKWLAVADSLPLKPVHEWQLVTQTTPSTKQGEMMAWVCRPDGEQTIGKMTLSHHEQGKVELSWKGDGRYEQRTGL